MAVKSWWASRWCKKTGFADTAAISVGDSRTLTYHGTCTADLRVVFDNRAAEERRGLDLCATPMLVIHPGWTTEDLPAVPPT